MPLEISLQKKTLIFNVLLFSAFFILNLNITPAISSLSWPFFIVLWLAAALLTLGSSFFVLVKPSSLYAKLKAYPVETALGILAGLSQFLYEFVKQNFWQYLASPTTAVVRVLLRLGGIQTESPHPQAIVHPLFSAWIGPGCDGFEGIFFFLFVFCILMMLDWKKHSPRRLFALFGGGILLMIALNVLRITLFFAAALWLTLRLGNTEAQEWFVWAFHSHVGWILYVIGIVLFVLGFLILPANRSRKII